MRPLTGELRAIKADRLDRYPMPLDAQIENPRAAARVARNIEEVAVKLSERRATLLGVADPDRSRPPSPKWLRRT